MSTARIAVIGLGGTISSVGVSELDVLDYPEYGTKLSAQEVVEGIPGVDALADIVASSVLNVGSSALEPTDWVTIHQHVVAKAEEGVDGVVILHGTATIEETAYFLNLSLPVTVPVVLVGSQRPYTTVSSDAQMNIVGAVRTALAARGRATGVLVVSNDEIHHAREVRKTANYRLNAFESLGSGPIGAVDGDQITWYRAITTRSTVESELSTAAFDEELPRVDIVYSYVGADGVAIDAAVRAGTQGIVVAGLAPGLPARGQLDSLLRARESGVRVVQASRALRDRVPIRRALKEHGFISGDNLSPQKCRILLQLGLASGRGSSEDLAHLFATH